MIWPSRLPHTSCQEIVVRCAVCFACLQQDAGIIVPRQLLESTRITPPFGFESVSLRIRTMTLFANWTRIAKCDAIQRSSLCVSSTGSSVYVFGGELKPRQPRDNNVHKVSLTGGEYVSLLFAPSVLFLSCLAFATYWLVD